MAHFFPNTYVRVVPIYPSPATIEGTSDLLNIDRHTVPVRLGDLSFPKAMEEYVSTGFVRQNHSVLEMLMAQNSDNIPKLTASAIFLPMIFPILYENMEIGYRQKFEKAAVGSYVTHAERMHAPYEKSPKDYMAFFNAKGFYFVRGKRGIRGQIHLHGQ